MVSRRPRPRGADDGRLPGGRENAVDEAKAQPVVRRQPAVPFWNDPAAYFVSKPFTITLPPGKWRLSVMRGDRIPAGLRRVHGDCGPDSWTVTFNWCAGWICRGRAGIPAICTSTLRASRRSQDVYIMTWAKSMDVHMTGVLSYGDGKEMEGCRSGALRQGVAAISEGDYWLESGHEDPREPIAEQGHVTQLNIQNIVRDIDQYQLYDYVFDGVHAQGGLVGYNAPGLVGGVLSPHTNPESHPGLGRQHQHDPGQDRFHRHPGSPRTWDTRIITISSTWASS